MLVALTKNDRIPHVSFETSKDIAPFICPECSREVILKKGSIKIHHYAHKVKDDCLHGGESEQHYTCKKEIYESLQNHPKCTYCELEKSFPGVRADIYAIINYTKVAIEVQRSNISIDYIQQKNEKYRQLGISVLWIIPKNPDDFCSLNPNNSHFFISKWKKYIHDMYGNRIYFWNKGLLINIFHVKRDFQIYFDAHIINDFSNQKNSFWKDTLKYWWIPKTEYEKVEWKDRRVQNPFERSR